MQFCVSGLFFKKMNCKQCKNMLLKTSFSITYFCPVCCCKDNERVVVISVKYAIISQCFRLSLSLMFYL